DAVTSAYLGLTRDRNRRQQTMRTETLVAREAELLSELEAINARLLDVGGEFGLMTMAAAHIEKIAQIDATAARKAEVEATLLALSQSNKTSSADMNDDEIMRATLLDRALADLNFEKVRHQATLATYLQLYTENARRVRDIRKKIAVVDQAMADRRAQIQILGQTGALTDQSSAGEQDSVAAIEDLLAKVTDRLATQRAEARDLNARRVELEFLENEHDEVYRMLKDTRSALDVIRVESNDALPGLIELMSPAVIPEKAAKDGSKMLGAAGLAGGISVATLLVLVAAFGNTRLRYSSDLWSVTHRVPVLGLATDKTLSDRAALERETDCMRNRIQLLPLRLPMAEDRGRIIAVARLARGRSDALALALADSFDRTGIRVLLIDADLAGGHLSENLDLDGLDGWTDLVRRGAADPVRFGSLDVLPSGRARIMSDADLALPKLRQSLKSLTAGYDVIVLNAGCLDESVSGEMLLSCADIAIGEACRGDPCEAILRHAKTLDERPRNGGAIWFANARGSDPMAATRS
ncbi:MAG: hypothetical protein AAF503_09985, partial [Pseudomonadota bacterium]